MTDRRQFRRIVLVVLALWGMLAMASPLFDATRAAPANHVVISEVQVGGGAANDEFIELHNPTDSTIVLTNWKLTKKTSGGAEENLVSSSGFVGTIPAHGFFLIAPQVGYTGATPPDLRYSQTSNFLADKNAALLYDKNGTLIDKVGWGTSPDFEGAPYPTNPIGKTSIERKAQASSTSTSMGPGGSDEFSGNGEDTNNK